MWRMVFVLVLMGLCVHTAAALPGSGTQQDPWRIESLADFDEFAADPNYWAGFTRLETDVNLAGRTYSTAIIAPDVYNSNWVFDGKAFAGIFDGNDHKIINLTIDDDGAGNDFLGLFGCIYQGEVRNLGLVCVCVSGDWYVAGLVGWNYGSVLNCYSTGDVSGTGVNVGGLVGYSIGSISNCYSTGSVSGYKVGGLVGSNGGSISNCYSTGDISGDGEVGGLVGYNARGSISNCYSTRDVTGNEAVGGLVGGNFWDGSVSNCYSTGSVSGEDWVGGMVGHNGYTAWTLEPGYISNSYSTGSVEGASDVGGLVGYNEGGTISSSFWDVQTSGEPNMCGSQSGVATGCDPNCGKTTAEMKIKSTFTSAGWDFIEIWGIGEHQTYPYLRFAPAGDLNYDKKVDLFDFAIFADHWLEGKGD